MLNTNTITYAAVTTLLPILFAGANRGIPDHLASQNSRTFQIDSQLIPSTNDALASYESITFQKAQTRISIVYGPVF